jgi:hypothetical protein
MHSYREPASELARCRLADPFRHKRRQVLASLLLLLKGERLNANWSLPQSPHVYGFTYESNRFLVVTREELEQIVCRWVNEHLWWSANSDAELHLMVEHLNISSHLVEFLNVFDLFKNLRKENPREFCKLIAPAILDFEQFVREWVQMKGRANVARDVICNTLGYKPKAWAEVERSDYLIYLAIDKSEVLPSALNLRIERFHQMNTVKESPTSHVRLVRQTQGVALE